MENAENVHTTNFFHIFVAYAFLWITCCGF